MKVAELLDRTGLTLDELVDALAERGITSSHGNAFDRRRIQRVKVVPKRWLDELGVDATTASVGAGDDDGGDSPFGGDSRTGRRESPPRRPSDAPIAIVDSPGAAKRIAGAYKFAGAALAAGSGSQGVAVVWADQSDQIAQLWLDAAKDNPWAARFVNLMQAGGTMGDLAAGHLYLAGATLYVLGAGIPGGDAIFAKYSRHRVVVTAAADNGQPEQQPEPASDDAAAAAAAGPVVDGSG